MHVERIFIHETGIKTHLPVEDAKRYANLALQVYGMGEGDKIRIFGSIIENEEQRWFPVKICKTGYTITTDGIYVIPSQHVYYKFELFERGTSNSIDASLYMVHHGSFPQCIDFEGVNLEVTIPITKGIQVFKSVKDKVLADTLTEITELQFDLSSGDDVYISDMTFSIIGSAADIRITYTPQGGVETQLFAHSLTAFQPSIPDSKADPIKVRTNINIAGTIKVKAKKFCRYDTDLNGSITLLKET